MSAPQQRPRRAAWWLGAYLCLLGAVGLWARAVDLPMRGALNRGISWLHDHGMSTVRYGHIEALANLALFVPLGFLLVLVLRPRKWWWAVIIGLVISVLIETGQLALSSRTPHLRDILFNSAGALAGALLCQIITKLRGRGVAHPPELSGLP